MIDSSAHDPVVVVSIEPQFAQNLRCIIGLFEMWYRENNYYGARNAWRML